MLKFTQYSLLNSQSINEGIVGRAVEMYQVISWNSIEKECTVGKIPLDNQLLMWLTVMAKQRKKKREDFFLIKQGFVTLRRAYIAFFHCIFFLWTVVKMPEWNFVKEEGIILLMALVDALAQFSVFVCVPWDLNRGWLYCLIQDIV